MSGPVNTSVDLAEAQFTHYLKYNPATASLSNYPVRGGDALQVTAVLRASDPNAPAHGLTRSVDRFTVRDVHPPVVVGLADPVAVSDTGLTVKFSVKETW
jgi:hypothetical protein